MLEKTEGKITNEQFRDTVNILYMTQRRQSKQKRQHREHFIFLIRRLPCYSVKSGKSLVGDKGKETCM
jgi:hypothetical protein